MVVEWFITPLTGVSMKGFLGLLLAAGSVAWSTYVRAGLLMNSRKLYLYANRFVCKKESSCETSNIVLLQT